MTPAAKCAYHNDILKKIHEIGESLAKETKDRIERDTKLDSTLATLDSTLATIKYILIALLGLGVGSGIMTLGDLIKILGGV